MDIKKEYERWLENATADANVAAELKTLDNAKIEDAFYRDLAFGTGGLRGVIGAGTNRMNIYTVAKASQGLADYLKKNFAEPSVAIGYDSRIKSDVSVPLHPQRKGYSETGQYNYRQHKGGWREVWRRFLGQSRTAALLCIDWLHLV